MVVWIGSHRMKAMIHAPRIVVRWIAASIHVKNTSISTRIRKMTNLVFKFGLMWPIFCKFHCQSICNQLKSLITFQCRPEEITVEAENNVIVVHAKQEEKKQGQNYMSREFVRSYELPPGYKPEDVIAILSCDGILQIKVSEASFVFEKLSIHVSFFLHLMNE